MRTSLLLAVALLAACGPAPIATHERAPAPPFEQQELLNGKRKVLQFIVDPWQFDRVAVGARLTVTVPRVPQVGHTIGKERWTHGASFTTSAAAGLDVTQTTHDDWVALSVRCAAPGTHELRFAALDADGTLTRDSIDLGCVTPTRLGIGLGDDATVFPAQYQRDGQIYVYVTRTGLGPDGAELQLTGDADVSVAPESHGLVAVVPPQFPSPNQLTLRAVALGEGASVVSTGLTAKLPLTVVDVTDWSPVVTATRDAYGPTDAPQYILDVQARMVRADGSRLYGFNSCAFESFVGDAGTPEGTDNCSLYGPPDSTVFKADRVCVTLLGRSACAAVPH
jgi:hypothetical protein